jgi:hypothetical protein
MHDLQICLRMQAALRWMKSIFLQAALCSKAQPRVCAKAGQVPYLLLGVDLGLFWASLPARCQALLLTAMVLVVTLVSLLVQLLQVVSTMVAAELQSVGEAFRMGPCCYPIDPCCRFLRIWES